MIAGYVKLLRHATFWKVDANILTRVLSYKFKFELEILKKDCKRPSLSLSYGNKLNSDGQV